MALFRRCIFIGIAFCLAGSGLVSPVIAHPLERRVSAGTGNPPLSPGISILTPPGDSLVFELNLTAYQIDQQRDESGPCQKLTIDGYSPSDLPGTPDLPVSSLMAGIPLDVTPKLLILEQEIVSIPGKFHFCPVTNLVVDTTLSGTMTSQGETHAEAPVAYSRDAYSPDQPVELLSTGMIRSQRVAQLRFNPFQYNPIRGELRAIRHMKVELQINSGIGIADTRRSASEGAFESLLSQSLVNYDQARHWRSASLLGVETATATEGYSTQTTPSYKITIDHDGLYQVTYDALNAAGISADILYTLDPHTFHLSNQNIEVPIYVTGEDDSQFNPGDSIFFYGQSIKTKFTDTNCYWLTWGSELGLRMAVLDGAYQGSAILRSSSNFNLHQEQNLTYFINNPSGPQLDHWYWTYLNANSTPVTKDFAFSIGNINFSNPTATISGLLKGYSANPRHHTRILINGHLIEDQVWPPTDDHQFSIEVPASDLIEGSNTLTIECPRDGGVTSDIVLVNWLEIDYNRLHIAEDGRLNISSQQGGNWEFQASGFASSAIDVLDITDPLTPKRVINADIQPEGSLYRLRFDQNSSGPQRFLALEPSRWLTPLSITIDTPSSLKDFTNGADYIIISPKEFMPAIQPLANFRTSQGYRVQTVDVQDIYDEFNGGVFDPEAIHNFLAYAYGHWSPPAPAYVLLVGDGHYDFKNNYGDSGPNYIPPYLGDLDPWVGETAADNRYVTVSGEDSLPDMFIGRLPANNPAEVTAMATKILAYEQEPPMGEWNSHLTFIADNPDSGGDFPWFSDKIADNFVPNPYRVEKIYFPATHPNIGDTRAAIVSAINQGRLIVNFTGHASIPFWASEQLFGVNNLSSLTNTGKYPFFVPMTCQEGYFINPKASGYNYPSLAESLVRADGKGAIASFSPTGFGLASGHDLLSQGLYTAIFRDGITQLGPATTAAKYFLYSKGGGFLDLLDTYMLFGDPATRLIISNPTTTALSSFTGQAKAGAIQLEWETAYEIGLEGFNIYRSETVGGDKVRLSIDKIPSQKSGQPLGTSYQFIDPVGPGKQYFYWLELVFTNTTKLNGPISMVTPYWLNLPSILHN